ncbi:hypothetical protein FHS49_000647 [Sphingobium boeckii]|uniref:Uncharacterized protein n=1 Tax=Sphingobium boeckii TaxID=1082345 RepID=A0A7W9AFP9_9SPHN|nr:hypothetical protein [Sphingobium boeckii]
MLGLLALALLAASPSTDPAAPESAAEKASDAQDKVICKRFLETGSLVKGYRSCKTKREWERERENLRARGPGSNSCRDAANGGAGCSP